MEIWKDILGFEGRYQVSNKGNVRSLSRLETTKAGWSRFKVGRILKQKHGNGQQRYRSVSLGHGNTRLVHRLVAETFILNPDNLPHVNHKDRNTINNSIYNLEWVTPQINSIHASGKAFSLCKGLEIKEFKSIAEAAKFLNSNNGNVSRLVNKIKYKQIKGWHVCP